MTQHLDIAIVVVAYNRPDSLNRLLDSLTKVNYEGHNVPLIISIDYSGKDDVYLAAEAFEWKFGDKKIIRNQENLGLKKHVLSCGDLVKEFDAVIILEDDLLVSPAMYSYAWRAVEKYRDDENVASISLYAKEFSETANKPFVPAFSGSDTYFIQTAESWGQIWTRDRWLEFNEWYKNNEVFVISPDIPKNVCEWDDKSWKKHHIRYCIEKNLFTVYPYMGLSTCVGEEGEHVKINMNTFQVPLLDGKLKSFRFSDFDDKNAIKYDAFLERIFTDYPDVCFDLYGQKTCYDSYRYVITRKPLNYKITETYGLTFRPHEDNILNREKGDYFIKYDLSQRASNTIRFKSETAMKYYNYVDFCDVTNQMRVKDIFSHLMRVIKYRIKKKLCRRKSI